MRRIAVFVLLPRSRPFALTRSEPASLVADLRSPHVGHHGEKRVRNRHRPAGSVTVDEEDHASGIAVDLGA